MTQQRPNPMFNLDALYCEEEHWEEGDGSCNEEEENSSVDNGCPLLLLSQEDLFWEDDDLSSLFCKEQEQDTYSCLLSSCLETDPFLSSVRREAVDWMLRVHAHYAFTALTAVLSVNYLDRFLSSVHFQKDKPWMAQLAAVACLSLAAKVEETQVPLLLDLQVEETTYVFEAKTIQRMELLVLSTLKWRMNPVTPLSFIDHIIRRLGLKTHLHWEFLRRCERFILSVIADPRYICYVPSVLAAATMLHVIHQLEPCNALEYENQLLGVLKICKEKVEECFQLMLEPVSGGGNKRKYISEPATPNGVLDTSFSCDSSNDSWASSDSSSLNPLKKLRTQNEKQMQMPSLYYMFIDVLSSP
ncbi:hypothetical protein MRB53_012098 [Persea americana]|uniref:Uncharacterized protein n=1 Tax=Persea americana TaxID=3435 RepID=A0ACC2LWT5_PERAE|nr:hypothetical protein MRB53_012098 [Persea americana]